METSSAIVQVYLVEPCALSACDDNQYLTKLDPASVVFNGQDM